MPSQRALDELAAAELARAVHLSRITPSPPRDVIANGPLLRWSPPPVGSTGSFTHYHVYANGDGDDKLVRELPSKQLALSDGLSGSAIFVSTYNATTRKESPRIKATGSLTSSIVALTHSIHTPTIVAGSNLVEYAFAPATGHFLTVDIVIPNVTDEYEITWGGQFDPDTPVTLKADNLARNIFFFTSLGVDLKWTLLSYRGYQPV